MVCQVLLGSFRYKTAEDSSWMWRAGCSLHMFDLKILAAISPSIVQKLNPCCCLKLCKQVLTKGSDVTMHETVVENPRNKNNFLFTEFSHNLECWKSFRQIRQFMKERRETQKKLSFPSHYNLQQSHPHAEKLLAILVSLCSPQTGPLASCDFRGKTFMSEKAPKFFFLHQFRKLLANSLFFQINNEVNKRINLKKAQRALARFGRKQCCLPWEVGLLFRFELSLGSFINVFQSKDESKCRRASVQWVESS